MKKVNEVLEEKLLPIAAKLGNNKILIVVTPFAEGRIQVEFMGS